MQRRHYEFIANAVANLPEDIRFVVAQEFATQLEEFSNFNKERFLKACGADFSVNGVDQN